MRAYALLVQSGTAGETYNVGSGHAHEIREILDLIISLSTKEIRVEIDPNKIRPVDVPIIEADITNIKRGDRMETADSAGADDSGNSGLLAGESIA